MGACSPSGPPTARVDAGPAGLTVRGRVVDAESCAMLCEAVSGVVVSAADGSLRSAPTGPDGAFQLAGLPTGEAIDLVAVPQDTMALRYAPTRNPEVVPPSTADVFGVRVHVVPQGAGSLLEAVEVEIGAAPRSLHLGQAVRVEGPGLVPVEGAGVSLEPTLGPVRFINVLPRFSTGEAALMASDAVATGRFGMYLIPSPRPGPDATTVTVTADGLVFPPTHATLAEDTVSFALHRGD